MKKPFGVLLFLVVGALALLLLIGEARAKPAALDAAARQQADEDEGEVGESGAAERQLFVPLLVGESAGAGAALYDAATDAVAAQQGIPAGQLAVIATAEASYPLTGARAHAFKVEDRLSGDLYSVLLDDAGGQLDESQLDDAEVAAYRARYGTLEQTLAELIESGHAADTLPLIIWLKEPHYEGPARDDANGEMAQRSADEIEAFQRLVDDRRSAAVAAINAPIVDRMNALGLEATADQYAPALFTRLTHAQLREVAAWPEVDRIYLDSVVEDHLSIARQVVRANTVNSRGMTGSGVRVAAIEPGGRLASGNPYLSGVVQDTTYICGSSTVDTHLTAVAGVIRSTHSTDRGIAPSATLRVGGSCDGVTSQLTNRASAAVTWGARVLNLSYGQGTNRVVNSSASDKFYDNLIMTTFRTVVASAGNAASPCSPGNGHVGSPGLAYNLIAVGNFNDQNSLSWTGDTFTNTCSSYVDPISTNGDREKPEVAAPGEYIATTSAASPWTGANWSGTSFSAPVVSGVAALMMQRHSSLTNWPEAVKAILMASAAHNIEGASRLSERDGAGGIMADRADDMARSVNGSWGGYNYSCTSPAATVYQLTSLSLTAGVRVRVAIAWDTPTSYSSYASKPSADLDLSIANASGSNIAVSTSYDNTYEIVDFTPATSGTYRVRVHRIRCDADPKFLGLAWGRIQ